MQAPLPWATVAAIALEAGFPPGDAVIAVSITEPESARIQDNVQAGQPYDTTGWGLWQITPGNSEPQFGTDDAMLIGLNNGRAAHAKWQGAGGFSPWTTYEHGLNTPYLPAAEQAVSAVSKLSLADLHRLVNESGAQFASGRWSPDAALMHADLIAKRLLLQFDKQLVAQGMELSRMGVPGWLP